MYQFPSGRTIYNTYPGMYCHKHPQQNKNTNSKVVPNYFLQWSNDLNCIIIHKFENTKKCQYLERHACLLFKNFIDNYQVSSY